MLAGLACMHGAVQAPGSCSATQLQVASGWLATSACRHLLVAHREARSLRRRCSRTVSSSSPGRSCRLGSISTAVAAGTPAVQCGSQPSVRRAQGARRFEPSHSCAPIWPASKSAEGMVLEWSHKLVWREMSCVYGLAHALQRISTRLRVGSLVSSRYPHAARPRAGRDDVCLPLSLSSLSLPFGYGKQQARSSELPQDVALSPWLH